MGPNPQLGSGQVGGDRRHLQPDVNIALACEVPPEFIVRYRPRKATSRLDVGDGATVQSVSDFAETFILSRDEAHEYAVALVHRGASEPNTISIYENTGARVAVSVQIPPRGSALR